MIIYLARHGETTGDIENRYGGDYDDHLTEYGKQESAELAENLFGKNIELLFASPLIRAQETSEIVGIKLGLVPKTLAGFKERNNYGILTGLIKEEAATKHPDQIELLKDFRAAVKGAESYADFSNRITAGLSGLMALGSSTVAIITHGGPMRLILRDVLGLGEKSIADCGYLVIEFANNAYTLLETHGIN